MRLLTILFLFASAPSWSQFSPILTIPSNYSGFDVNSFNCNESGQMMLITDPYDGGPIADLQIYTSLDSGQSWDSTLLPNMTMSRYNAAVTENGNFYVATRKNVYPTNSTPYQRKMAHRSLDNGLTWQYQTIDTISGSGQHKENSFSFINDSTGMYFNPNGKFLTQDYGSTWQKISSVGAEHLGVLDDQFIYYWYQCAMSFDPITNQIDSFDYSPFCEGNVMHSFFKDGVSYRMIFGSDGEDWGGEYNHNYASLNIDELPLGDQRVIHFPQDGALVDIDATSSCIHLVLSGRYARSCDGGNSFHFVDAFNGNMNEQVMFLEFINDTLGYLVSQNLTSYEWHLWETTNGGGQNLEEVLTNQSMASVHDIDAGDHFSAYPNPASDEISIVSEEEIVKVEVYSMDGKVVLVEEIGSTSGKLVISQLSVGTYVLKVYSLNSVGVSRLVRE